MDVPVTYHYSRMPVIFGSPVTYIEVKPKFNSKGGIDNRYILLLGQNQNDLRGYLMVIIFNSPLLNLPHASVQTPLQSVIGYSGFKSSLTLISFVSYLRTEPEFPDIVITSGFKADAFTVFKINKESLDFLHSIAFPKYCKEGIYSGSLSINTVREIRTE